MRHVAFVLGSSGGGMGAHVRMLASGCAARGLSVAVHAPSLTGRDLGLGELPGVDFAPVEFGGRPRGGDIRAVLRLRRLLATRSPEAGVVHAHGLRAGALAVLALAGVREARRPVLVVTVHNGPPAAGVAAGVYGMLERMVARGAGLVLCVSGDLEARMRAAGARRVGRAVVPAPAAPVPAAHPPASPAPAVPARETRMSERNGVLAGGAGASGPAPGPGGGVLPPSAAGRPVVLGVGRLAAQKGFGTLLEAAVAWRDMDPVPLVVIAGEGPLEAELRERAAALGVDAVFLGRRGDVPALLAAAGVFVLPSAWEGQPLVLQEALRAGAPVVATRVGGVAELAGGALAGRGDPPGGRGPAAGAGLPGEDSPAVSVPPGTAALLVPPGDAARLAAAVRAVLTDQALAARLRAAALRRAAGLPAEDGAVDAALASYAAALRAAGRAIGGGHG